MITADQILHELETLVIKEVSVSHGEKKAIACSKALFDCLWINFRKSLMYVPTTDKEQFIIKYETIWNDFTGRNHQDLAIKYRLSLQQIYNIIKVSKRLNTPKYQDDIFPLSEDKTTKPLTLYVLDEYLPHELTKCGLSDVEAKEIAKKIAIFLCANFPGISICISDALKKKRSTKNQDDIFG